MRPLERKNSVARNASGRTAKSPAVTGPHRQAPNGTPQCVTGWQAGCLSSSKLRKKQRLRPRKQPATAPRKWQAGTLSSAASRAAARTALALLLPQPPSNKVVISP